MGEEPRGLSYRDGCTWICVQPPPSSSPLYLVTPLLMGPVCLLIQGQSEEPVRPDLDLRVKTTDSRYQLY